MKTLSISLQIPSVIYLGYLATSSGSLGLLNSIKKVINFCNIVDGRRLSKCANQGGSSSPLLVHLFYLGSLIPFSSCYPNEFLIHFCKSLP